MTDANPVTIYTTHPCFGNIVRYQGDLQDYGCQPRKGSPTAAYVRFVPRGKVSQREIMQTTDPYILITAGYDGVLTPDMFAVTSTLTGLTIQHEPVCTDPDYRDHFDRLIQPLIDSGRARIIADYRPCHSQAARWSHTPLPPVRSVHAHAVNPG